VNPPRIEVLPEPELEFRNDQRCVDPHGGLGLFGPYDLDRVGRPGSLAYGLIGTPAGVRAFREFAARLAEPIVSRDMTPARAESKDPFLWPPFPGVEAAFGVPWSMPAWEGALDAEVVEQATTQGDAHQRAFDLTNLYLEQIRVAAERDHAPRVLLCVVPDDVWRYCRPSSRPPPGTKGLPRRVAELRRQQQDLFNSYDPKQYELSPDFRRQLKARSMEFGLPVQLVRESTLRLRDEQSSVDRSLTPLSDRAWNLTTTLYYKAGGRPWRLGSARDGVCYVGIAFRRSERSRDERTACCAAQMFLDTGDGVVFRGQFGPWYSPERRQFHLAREAARDLLEGVLRVYREQGGPPLREIFLHSRSGIDRDEFDGYAAACPSDANLVGIRVQRDPNGLRAYREGRFPVLRGVVWQASERTAYLWTAGFKPSLLTYDGWETPVPLRVDVQHGTAPVDLVARDIMGLTKLNYNACRLGDAMPVTIKFSDMVGEILVSNPTVEHRRPNFKFYI
jgi:hypothetical protein